MLNNCIKLTLYYIYINMYKYIILNNWCSKYLNVIIRRFNECLYSKKI